MRWTVLLLLPGFLRAQDRPPPLADLGEIVAAVVVYTPTKTARPAITFRFKDGRRKTIGLGETLLDKHYKFTGCRRDKDKRVEFLFDVMADGKDIVIVKSRDPARDPARAAIPGVVGLAWWRPPSRIVGDDPLFYRVTPHGQRLLRKRYADLLREVRTRPSSEPKGLRIDVVRSGSTLREFLKTGDVLLDVNGKPCPSPQAVVKIIREQLAAKQAVFKVKRWRSGKTEVLTFKLVQK